MKEDHQIGDNAVYNGQMKLMNNPLQPDSTLYV